MGVGVACLPGTAASHSGSARCSLWELMSHLATKMRSHLLPLLKVATRLHTGARSSLHASRANSFSSSSSLGREGHSLMAMTPLPLDPELPASTVPLPGRILLTPARLEQLPKEVFLALALAACSGQDVVHTVPVTSSLATPLQESPLSLQALTGRTLLGLPTITTTTTHLPTLHLTSCSRLSCCSPTLLTRSLPLQGIWVAVARRARVRTPWTRVC